MGCRLVVGNSFHQAVVYAYPRLDKLFPVACYGRGAYLYILVHYGVEFFKLIHYDLKGLTLVCLIVAVKQLVIGGDEHQLCGGGACIYAQVGITLVGGYIRLFQVVYRMGADEVLVFLLACEQSFACDDGIRYLCILYAADDLIGSEFLTLCLCGIEGAAVCHEALCIFGEYSVLLVKGQGLYKVSPKPLYKGQRSSQKKHLPLYLTPLCKT